MAKVIARYVGKTDPVVDAAIVSAAGRTPDDTGFAYPSGPNGKIAVVTVHTFTGEGKELSAINDALKPIVGVEAFIEK
jgi:hypothetical protein